MATNVYDWLDEALDALYGPGDTGTRYVQWMADNGLTWGTSLSDFYMAAAVSAETLGDAMYEFWANGGGGGPTLPANGIVTATGEYIVTATGEYVVWS